MWHSQTSWSTCTKKPIYKVFIMNRISIRVMSDSNDITGNEKSSGSASNLRATS